MIGGTTNERKEVKKDVGILGAFTPPIGINLFVLKEMNKQMPMGTIYRGAILFAIASIISVIILFFVPSIITWLLGILEH